MTHRILQWYEQFATQIWGDDLRELSSARRLIIVPVRLLIVLTRQLLQGQLNLRAMSLVYTTLLSVVPLLAVSFSVLKGFGVHNQIEPVLTNFLAPLGPRGYELSDNIIGFVENIRVGVLGSLGLVFLLYTVVSLIQKVESTFNYVWQVERLRGLTQRFSSYLSVILIGPVLVFTALGVTATAMNNALVQVSDIHKIYTLFPGDCCVQFYLYVYTEYAGQVFPCCCRWSGCWCSLAIQRLGICGVHCFVIQICSNLLRICDSDTAADLALP
jgi:membrane protein